MLFKKKASLWPELIHDGGAEMTMKKCISVPPWLSVDAGGLKSKADIAELLKHNPEADLDSIRNACKRYRLCGLNEILCEL